MPSGINIVRLLIALSCFLASSPRVLYAKDFGVQGATFQIKEVSLLDIIYSRLKALKDEGKLEDHQQEIQKRVRHSIEHPLPIEGIESAVIYKSRIYDPSIRVDEDIKDHNGRILVRKGTTVNPLDHHTFGKPLVFVKGDDKKQLEWALKQGGKVVLVSGSPLYLARAYKQAIYFDQGGILSKKFSIKAVPAKVSQKGDSLLIEEIKLEGEER